MSDFTSGFKAMSGAMLALIVAGAVLFAGVVGCCLFAAVVALISGPPGP